MSAAAATSRGCDPRKPRSRAALPPGCALMRRSEWGCPRPRALLCSYTQAACQPEREVRVYAVRQTRADVGRIRLCVPRLGTRAREKEKTGRPIRVTAPDMMV